MYLNRCQMLIKYTTAESSLTNTKSNKVPHQVGNLCCQKLFLSMCNVIRSKVIETFSNLNKVSSAGNHKTLLSINKVTFDKIFYHCSPFVYYIILWRVDILVFHIIIYLIPYEYLKGI